MKLVSRLVHNYVFIIISPSASAGSDYFAINTSKTFHFGSPNNEMLCVIITLIDDFSLEGDQKFNVVVMTTDPDVIIDNFMTSLRIIDDDG